MSDEEAAIKSEDSALKSLAQGRNLAAALGTAIFTILAMSGNPISADDQAAIMKIVVEAMAALVTVASLWSKYKGIFLKG